MLYSKLRFVGSAIPYGRCPDRACALRRFCGRDAHLVGKRLFAISKRATSRACRCAATACSRWRRNSRSCTIPRPRTCGALARDSKGNLYTGGGPGAKLYRISPKGEKKTLAELEGLEIHAIAVDAKDRVYAATSPDGKVYRIAGDGKPEVFYDPKQKYIWAMAFDSNGDLFMATGDQGEIHKVTPDGKGSVFFKTEETARPVAWRSMRTTT